MKGLGKVIIRTKVQAAHPIAHVIAGREQDDRRIIAASPQLRQNREAVIAGSMISSTTASTGAAESLLRAPSPSAAVSTSHPESSSARESGSRMSRASSTSKSLMQVLPQWRHGPSQPRRRTYLTRLFCSTTNTLTSGTGVTSTPSSIQRVTSYSTLPSDCGVSSPTPITIPPSTASPRRRQQMQERTSQRRRWLPQSGQRTPTQAYLCSSYSSSKQRHPQVRTMGREASTAPW